MRSGGGAPDRSRPGRAGRVYAVLWLLALAALAAALQEQRAVVAEYRVRGERATQSLVRLGAMDRLVGRRLPAVRAAGRNGGHPFEQAGRVPRVVWVVDVERCVGCLDGSLDRWHGLLARAGMEGVLVLSHADEAQAERIARTAGVRSDVWPDPGARLSAALGLAAPWVAFVADPMGRIVLADAGLPGPPGACGRGFFERVAALYGGGRNPEDRVEERRLSSRGGKG